METGPEAGSRAQSSPSDDISGILRARWSQEAEIAVVWGRWAWAHSGQVLEKYAEWPMLFHCGMTILIVWLAGRSGINIFFVLCVALYYMHEIATRQRTVAMHRIRHSERAAANQRRPMSDTETCRWLNTLLKRTWPICVEKVCSQEVIPALAPWFFDKYKPWHVVLEVSGEFVVSEDMYAVIAGKARNRLGMGLWATCHVSNLIIEGKVRVGMKFVPGWPYISRMRICFAGAPYVSLAVKPIINFGVDVAELPGIAGWLDKILSTALELSMVEPNMLVVDVKKMVDFYMPKPHRGSAHPPPSPGAFKASNFFHVEETAPCAEVLIELIGAMHLNSPDSRGHSDAYVKGALGGSRFESSIRRKTTAPQWLEEFRAPICSWELLNLLVLRVRDRSGFKAEELGYCVVDLAKYRGGQRFEFWEDLKKVKKGRIHLAITVTEGTPPTYKGGPNQRPEATTGAERKQGAAAECGDGVATRFGRKGAKEREAIIMSGIAEEKKGRGVGHGMGESSQGAAPTSHSPPSPRSQVALGLSKDGVEVNVGRQKGFTALAKALPRSFSKSAPASPTKGGGGAPGGNPFKDSPPPFWEHSSSDARFPHAFTGGRHDADQNSDLGGSEEGEGEEEEEEEEAEEVRQEPSAVSSGGTSPRQPVPRGSPRRSVMDMFRRSPRPSPPGSPPTSPSHLAAKGALNRAFTTLPLHPIGDGGHPLCAKNGVRDEEAQEKVGRSRQGVGGVCREPAHMNLPKLRFVPRGVAGEKDWGREGGVKDEVEAIPVGLGDPSSITCLRPGDQNGGGGWRGRTGGRKSEAAARAGYLEGEGRKSVYDSAIETLKGKKAGERGEFDGEGTVCDWRGEKARTALPLLEEEDGLGGKKKKWWKGGGNKKAKAALVAGNAVEESLISPMWMLGRGHEGDGGSRWGFSNRPKEGGGTSGRRPTSGTGQKQQPPVPDVGLIEEAGVGREGLLEGGWAVGEADGSGLGGRGRLLGSQPTLSPDEEGGENTFATMCEWNKQGRGTQLVMSLGDGGLGSVMEGERRGLQPLEGGGMGGWRDGVCGEGVEEIGGGEGENVLFDGFQPNPEEKEKHMSSVDTLKLKANKLVSHA